MDPVDTFQHEASEHLAALETALLALEESPSSEQHIAEAFRAIHTIKGAAGMVGFDYISNFTHHFETLLDQVRNQQVTLNTHLCQLLLQAADHIQQLLLNAEPSEENKEISDNLIEQIQMYLPTTCSEGGTLSDKASAKADINENIQSANSSQPIHSYEITIVPEQEAFQHGFDFLPLLRELKELSIENTFLVETTFSEATEHDNFKFLNCQLHFQVQFDSDVEKHHVQDVFLFVVDDWQIDIKHQVNTSSEKPLKESSSTENLKINKNSDAKEDKAKLESQTTRVPQVKLDSLMDQVGELVILQASLEALSNQLDQPDLDVLSEDLERLTNNLRDLAFDIRMLPIGSAFTRFKRLVRDISKETGKELTLRTLGGETELDKVVLDKLIDPLIHLLRNSLDHGIEAPDVRLAKGKPEKGTITLSAWHAQGQVQIQIKDDGAGLDQSVILNKAIERGIVSANEELSTEQIHQLIFEAGFSTAEKVTDLSGRGVGMDVVRSSIEALQGKVRLSSIVGEGTSVDIQLPMTLSIIDGLLVRVDTQHFIIPLSQVSECVEYISDNSGAHRDNSTLEHRDCLIPNIRLRKTFELSGQVPKIEQVVIVTTQDGLIGITVDSVDGNHQTVIRDIGRIYKDTKGIMGATILGDGDIAMILDVAELAHSH